MKPNRGDVLNAAPSCSSSPIPWPAWKAPLNRFEPGVSRPMKRSVTVLAIVGVTPELTSAGSIPRRLSPEHGEAPMQTGLKSFAAALRSNRSGRKFDACRVVSHCGVR